MMLLEEMVITFDDLFRIVLFQNRLHDAVVFGCVFGPVNLHAPFFGVLDELQQHLIEVSQHILFDFSRCLPQLLPFRNGLGHAVPFFTNEP